MTDTKFHYCPAKFLQNGRNPFGAVFLPSPRGEACPDDTLGRGLGRGEVLPQRVSSVSPDNNN
jgi:hypothetical protein